MGERVQVAKLPPCDICQSRGRVVAARYDAKTKMGPWAYMCESHWRVYRLHSSLGTGKGQLLVTEGE